MNLNFQESFQINNKIIGSIKIQELLKYKDDIIIPYNQRLWDKDKTNEILKYQLNYFNKNGYYNFLGVINFHFCKKESKYYLVDGQHRYQAILNLSQKIQTFNISIEIVLIEEYEDILDGYNLINKNTPLPELCDNIDDLKFKKIFNYFEDYFCDVWTLSSRPRRPYMSKNRFQEGISYLIKKLDNREYTHIIKLIEEHNDRVSRWNLDKIGNMRNLKNPEKTLETCKKIKCYLGLFKYTEEEYIFKWVNDIIRNETGSEIKKKKNIKRKIPKSIKQEVWNYHLGEDKGSSLCLVCNKVKILQGNFVAGHIIPECIGGVISVENLRPICNSCNLSMGKENMNDYIAEYYPENTKNLNINTL